MSSTLKNFETFAPNSNNKNEFSEATNKFTSAFTKHNRLESIDGPERLVTTQDGLDHEIKNLKCLLGTMASDIDLRVRTPLFMRNLEQMEPESTQEKGRPYMSPRTMRKIYGHPR
jgi:hypothetical protein